MTLGGKVAIVTGGTKGIGLAISRALAQSGASVVMASVDGPDIREIAAEEVSRVKVADSEIAAVYCDVSDGEQVDGLVREVANAHGGIDILVNNAGISGYFDFFDMPLESWQRVMDVNYGGVFLCSRAVARVMVEKKIAGRIITTTSLGVFCGSADQFHYTPTKAAAHNLMMSLAIILGPYGITCNSVAPGPILTDLNRERLADDDFYQAVVRRTCVGRIGEPKDVVAAYVYLASDDASFTTGACIRVDGGALVHVV